MLDYLLAVLVAPLLRWLFGLCLRVMAIAMLVTVPGRLLLGNVESRASDEALMLVNAVSLALVVIIGFWHLGRRR